YRWEQLIYEDKIRFLYNPDDFQAGGDVARVLVVDRTQGRVKILWDRSEFVQPPLNRKSINVGKNEFIVTIPADARSGEYPFIVTLDCATATCPPGTFYVPVKNDDDQILSVAHETHVATIFGGKAVNLAQFKALTSSYKIFGTRISIDPAQADRGFTLALVQSGGTPVTIRPGRPHPQYIELRRSNWVRGVLDYVDNDWTGKTKPLLVVYEYIDQYGRDWTLRQPVAIELYMPVLSRIVWTVVLLIVGAIIGVIARFVLGTVVTKFSLETSVAEIGSSALLALVFCVLGVLLGVRLQPVGAFELSFTNLKGVLLIGVLAGFMPDVLRRMIDGWFPKKGDDKKVPPATSSPGTTAATS
ncbi:MAG: hypothetical protein HYS77_13995, partial [Candidatus Rokubacteria bacterium]|nr:hypothetical protein [Candidatus Rokubacteria bacterium]